MSEMSAELPSEQTYAMAANGTKQKFRAYTDCVCFRVASGSPGHNVRFSTNLVRSALKNRRSCEDVKPAANDPERTFAFGKLQPNGQCGTNATLCGKQPAQ